MFTPTTSPYFFSQKGEKVNEAEGSRMFRSLRLTCLHWPTQLPDMGQITKNTQVFHCLKWHPSNKKKKSTLSWHPICTWSWSSSLTIDQVAALHWYKIKYWLPISHVEGELNYGQCCRVLKREATGVGTTHLPSWAGEFEETAITPNERDDSSNSL